MGGWGPEMFFESLPKCSAQFSLYSSGQLMCGLLYVCMTPLFFKFIVPVLRSNEEGFNDGTFSQVHLESQVVASPFEPFPRSMDVWYHYGDVFAI